jgi:PAS domain S-box-containing protein
MAAEESVAREPGAAELRRRVAELEAEIAELRRAPRVAVELEAGRAAALRDSEARFRLVVESATDYAIFTMDLERRVTGWNAGAERVLGWPEEEILGRSADAIFTPEDRKAGAPEEEARAAVGDGRAEDVRWHLRRDGSRFWANGVMLPLRDDAGAIQGLLKILRDKTAEKRAADELREKAGFLERVLESSADCIKVLDLDGRLLFVSAGGLAALEIDDFETVRGRPWVELWPAEAADAVRAALETAKAGGTARFQGSAP